MSIISDLDSLITKVITVEVADGSQLIAEVIQPLVGAAVMLFLMYSVYKSFFDAPNLMVMDVIKNVMALAVVTTFAFNMIKYNAIVVPFVMESGGEISAFLMGGASAISSIDIMNDAIWSAAWGIVDSVEFDLMDMNFGVIISAFFMFGLIVVLGMPFIVVSAAYLLVAKVMVGLLLIVGPIFISMAFFPATRDMFKSWSGQCFNYILLNILYSIAFGVLTQAIDTLVFSGGFTATYTSTAALALVMIVCFIVALQIPVLASSISGGIGISGLAGNLNTLKGAVGGMGKMTGANAAGRAIGGAASKAGSRALKTIMRSKSVEAA
ncbi:type IV secretion system protein [Enterovibrio calviensis]|uniref:type IV secretion system protein n=1 Tax=Enterovibrio calviensis TaxID=91359 RepID=UPI003736AAA6